MSIEQLATSTADSNLAAGATLLSATPHATENRLVQAMVYLGTDAKPLNGDGGVLTVTVTIGGQTVMPVFTVPMGESKQALWGTPIPVPANTVITIAATSDDPADDDVTCTAKLFNVGALTATETQASAQAAITASALATSADVAALNDLDAAAVQGAAAAAITAASLATAAAVADIPTNAELATALDGLVSDAEAGSLVDGILDAIDAIPAAVPTGAVLTTYGPVLDTNGDPIEHVTVTFDDGAGHVFADETNALGEASLYLAPGTYTVRAYKDGLVASGEDTVEVTA